MKQYLADRRRTRRANFLIVWVAGITLSVGLFIGFLFFHEIAMEAMYPIETGWVVDVGPEYGSKSHMTLFANQHGEGWQKYY